MHEQEGGAGDSEIVEKQAASHGVEAGGELNKPASALLHFWQPEHVRNLLPFPCKTMRDVTEENGEKRE